MDLGLNWPSPNIYDAKKTKALHHPQNLSTLQGIEHPNTTINQGNKTEDPSFLSGMKKLGNAARGKILEVLPGKFNISNSLTGRVLVTLLSFSLMPAIMLILTLIIQLCIVLFRMGHILLISLAVFRNLK